MHLHQPIYVNISIPPKIDYPEDTYDERSQQGDVTCNHYMEINKGGEAYQTDTIEGMRHTIHVNLSHDQLLLWVSVPVKLKCILNYRYSLHHGSTR